MEIVLGKHQGFCGGVRRAVEMSEVTGTQTGGKAQTWGPLIHNPQVVSRLKEAGVGVAEAPDATVLVSVNDWAAMLGGKLDPALAYFSGRLRVKGDLSLVTRCLTLFS